MANFSLGAVFQSSQKATLKRFDTWSLRLILLDAPAGKTRLETPFVMTATLNSHILMQVPNLNAWSPTNLSNREAKTLNFCIQFIQLFCNTGFWWPWRSRAHMVAGYQKNNQPKHGDFFFPRKKSSENHREKTWKPLESNGIHVYLCIHQSLGKKVWKFKQDMFFFLLKGQISLGKTQHTTSLKFRDEAVCWFGSHVWWLCWACVGPFCNKKPPTKS